MSKLLRKSLLNEVYETIIKGERFTFISNQEFQKGDFLLLNPMNKDGVVDEESFFIVKVIYCDVLEKVKFDLKKTKYIVAVDIKKGFNPLKSG